MNPTPRTTDRRSRLARIVVLTSVCLMTASAALAQAPKKDEPLKPPTPPSTSTNWSPVLSLLVGIGLGGLVLGAAFIPSKRGHQD